MDWEKNFSVMPPAISDMVLKLFDEGTPIWNKENIAAVLVKIESVCKGAVAQHEELKRRAEAKAEASKTSRRKVASRRK